MILDKHFTYDTFEDALLDAKAKELAVVAIWTGTNWKFAIKDSKDTALTIMMRNRFKREFKYVSAGYDSSFRKRHFGSEEPEETAEDQVSPEPVTEVKEVEKSTTVKENDHAKWS